jgi:amino acid transporter
MLLAFFKRREFLSDLRGSDKRWQLVEYAAIVWAILFPTVVICDIFGIKINAEVWLSLDSLFIANLSKKSFDKYVEHKYSKQSNSEESSETNGNKE